MWTRKCEDELCKGTQYLVEMKCGLSNKSKGNWWRCKDCGLDSPEFALEVGDYEVHDNLETVVSKLARLKALEVSIEDIKRKFNIG